MEQVLLEQEYGGQWIAFIWVKYDEVITRLVGLHQANPGRKFRMYNPVHYITD